MKQHSTKIRENREMLLKSLQLSKKLKPEQRFEAFLELQEALIITYFTGLQNRYPDMSPSELLKLAKKENYDHGNE